MISSRIKRSPNGLVVAFAAWTALAAFVVGQRYFFALSIGTRFNLLLAAVENFSSCWLWAAITPLIFELSRRFPLQAGVWRKNLVFHVMFSILFLLADVLLEALLASRIPSMRRLPFVARVWSRSFINLYAYGAVVAVAYALQYSRQLSERKTRTAELEKEILGARLSALQMQLRPHFLFNALNSVASLVRSQQPSQAIRAITGLADLLRFVLKRDGAQLVPLREEMELVDRYLRIEQIRFENRLVARLDVDPQVLDALVPCLLIQPLVENAVQHGIDSGQGVGRVEVEVKRDAGMLRVCVRNSGAVLDLASARQVKDGIGLGNTRARLRHLYGERHHLELRPEAHGGALAELTIPFHTEATTQKAI